MGTDIHFYVERRESSTSPWRTADTWKEETFLDESYTSVATPFYDDRNYDLFAILANVRNGFGFAGVSTGSGFNIISEPRGWPEDCCPELQAMDIDHTPSWLTLAEILAFDWTQVTTKIGWVTLEEWVNWKVDGEPKSWCGGVSGRNIILEESIISSTAAAICPQTYQFRWKGNDHMLKLQQALAPVGKEPYTQVSWQKTYASACAQFWTTTIPRLLVLGEPNNVRCVFYFDS